MRRLWRWWTMDGALTRRQQGVIAALFVVGGLAAGRFIYLLVGILR
jgi:hypothetical protein